MLKVVECLAKELGSLAAFINLRRNRYDIAVSFTREFRTPCFFGDDKNESALTDKKEHPSTSYCPLDGQPLIHLPVPRKTWNDLTSFQKFLWQADEVTLRYSHMKSNIPGPRYYELIWSTAADLENGLSELREMFGCEEAGPVPNKKGHVSHKPGVLNCTEFVLSDLQVSLDWFLVKRMNFCLKATLVEMLMLAFWCHSIVKLSRRTRISAEFCLMMFHNALIPYDAKSQQRNCKSQSTRGHRIKILWYNKVN